jgi:ribosomal protein S18 acetylase RimI-like enzyme
MIPLEIRSAATAEQQPLFILHEKLFREEIEQIWGWDNASQWQNFLTEWAESETLAIVKDGKLIGCLQYFTRGDHLYLFNLAIEPECQNQGVGSEGLSWLKKEARSREIAIELKVFKTNPGVLNFYRRHGFEIIEEIETAFRLRWSESL